MPIHGLRVRLGDLGGLGRSFQLHRVGCTASRANGIDGRAPPDAIAVLVERFRRQPPQLPNGTLGRMGGVHQALVGGLPAVSAPLLMLGPQFAALSAIARGLITYLLPFQRFSASLEF